MQKQGFKLLSDINRDTANEKTSRYNLCNLCFESKRGYQGFLSKLTNMHKKVYSTLFHRLPSNPQ